MKKREPAKPKKSVSGKSKSVSRTVRIANQNGLHARPSALVVQTAGQFPHCRITISHGGESVNGRSIMGIMTLAAGVGSQVTIRAEGKQAEEAVEAIVGLIKSKFDEE